jgi:flagellar protein FlbD
MIQVARLNGNPLVVNSDLIRYVESSPDTTLTLINGEKIVVLESCEEVISRTITYRARLLSEVARISPATTWWAPPISAAQALAEMSSEQFGETHPDSDAAQRRRAEP